MIYDDIRRDYRQLAGYNAVRNVGSYTACVAVPTKPGLPGFPTTVDTRCCRKDCEINTTFCLLLRTGFFPIDVSGCNVTKGCFRSV